MKTMDGPRLVYVRLVHEDRRRSALRIRPDKDGDGWIVLCRHRLMTLPEPQVGRPRRKGAAVELRLMLEWARIRDGLRDLAAHLTGRDRVNVLREQGRIP